MRLYASSLVLAIVATGCGGGGAPNEDASTSIDASAGNDAGGPIDAGAPIDAASSIDAGPRPDTGSTGDLDLDGLDDAYELQIAGDYLPYLSVSDMDHCARSGILFRLRPHPADASRIAVTYIMLYENDCGAGGHIGDDEAFGVTIDPSRPAPAGLLSVRTIAHQNTACQSITECGSCAGETACTTGMRRGAAYPAIFASRDKHGWYATERACDGACFFTNTCDMSAAPNEPVLYNAGEPAAPLIHDLTDAGLITAANGWTQMSLFHFDPWASMNFGGAGDTTSDLNDPAFLTPACP